VELRFFGGLTMQEISSELDLGLRTVEQDWSMARAWIRRELKKDRTSASATQKLESEIKPLRRNLDDS